MKTSHYLNVPKEVVEALEFLKGQNKQASELERAHLLRTADFLEQIPLIWRDLPTCLFFAQSRNDGKPWAMCWSVPRELMTSSSELRQALIQNCGATLNPHGCPYNVMDHEAIDEEDVVAWLETDPIHHRVRDMHPDAQRRLLTRDFVLRLFAMKRGQTRFVCLAEVPRSVQDKELVLAFIAAGEVGRELAEMVIRPDLLEDPDVVAALNAY